MSNDPNRNYEERPLSAGEWYHLNFLNHEFRLIVMSALALIIATVLIFYVLPTPYSFVVYGIWLFGFGRWFLSWF